MLTQMDITDANPLTGEVRKWRFMVKPNDSHTSEGVVIQICDLTYAGRADRESWYEHGQPVTQYFAATLATHAPGVGLDMHGGIEAWKLSAGAASVLSGFCMAHVTDAAELKRWGGRP